MKKLFCAILAVMMLLSLAACGGEDNNQSKVPTNLNLTEIYTTMTSGVEMPDMMQVDSSMLLDLYGLKSSDYTQAVVYLCVNSLRADEIWLLEAADADALARLKSKAQARLDQKDAESVTYSPEQNAIVKAAKLFEAGNYLVMIVSPEATAIEAAFRTAAGI